MHTLLLFLHLAQNLAQVYNRDDTKRMKDGQRYHQSREGGSIHTDNVNIPELWDYMNLTCLQVCPIITLPRS